MIIASSPCRWLACLCLAILTTVTTRPVFGAEEVVPSPLQAFYPEANSALYVDIAAVRQSPLWQMIAEQVEDLPETMAELPGAEDFPIPTELMSMEMLQGIELAELVVVVESSAESAATDAFSADDRILIVARLATLLEDQEAFIGQLLAEAEQLQTGLSNQVAATRSTQGAAELFSVPSEALGDQQLPFPVGLAIGPGQDGTVLALGRADQLADYLNGQSSGEVPGKVTTLLRNRGQIWAYSAIPPGMASQAVAASDPAAAANPMVGGVAEALDDVSDFGLNLDVTGGNLAVDVVLGCVSNEAASGMAEGVQSLLAMGMMGSQDRSQMPGFLRNLKVEAAAEVFRLSTSVSQLDMQMMMQGIAMATQGGRSSNRQAPGPNRGSGRAKVVVEPLPDAAAAPATIEFLRILPNDGGHVRNGKLRIDNTSAKAISEIRIAYTYLDARGVKLGSWTRQQIDPSGRLALPNRSQEVEVPLFNLPARTQKVEATLLQVVFTDGSRWSSAAQ